MALLLGSLGGCSTPAPVRPGAPPPPPQAARPEAPPCPPAAASAAAEAAAPGTTALAEVEALLAYHQDLRALPAADLARELAGLNAQPRSPALLLRRAMVLGQGRSSSELALAQAQLDALATWLPPPADPLRLLAALLSARLAEQRRAQDAADRLGQQLRDSQRRNEQLNEKLEALKAIEQRLPAVPAANASRPP